MAHDFLFELGCEELPSGSVWVLAEAFANAVLASFDKAQLHYGAIHHYASPRRIGLRIEQLQAQQAPQTISRRGPALAAAYDTDKNPTPALLGFARSFGVDVSALIPLETDKGAWLVYEECKEGSSTERLLPAIIHQALATLPITKPMRWGSGDTQFVRPVHWAVLLYGELALEIPILGVLSGRYSQGHRFHHPEKISIDSPATYESQLRDAKVIADFSSRRQMIIDQVAILGEQHQAEVIMPDALLDEVTSIVEWPQALLVGFDREFLEVPSEALIASMQSHQKCFALRDRHGQLIPYFITVANIQSSDATQIIRGNEKVMRARLSDAAFFFRQDQKQPLSARIPATAQVVFQTRLGSLQDKALRTQALMEHLAHPLNLSPEHASRAALLSQCDLLTGMVGEFPELQGLMGYYYAQNDGEDTSVAVALNEQYMPRFSGDSLPQSPLGLALSLAGRIDTLVGIFAIGQKPSGVKDPFKLRRHALAVARLLQASSAQLQLSTIITESIRIYGETFTDASAVAAELKAFILERLVSFYQAQGISADILHAVRARQDEWLYDWDQRVKALISFIALPAGAALSAACKRVNNLLNQANLDTSASDIECNLLEAGAELDLFGQLQSMEDLLEPLYIRGDYDLILRTLAGLREPVDCFFENVMVMVDDVSIKINRLRLLARLQRVLQGVADISLLQPVP